MTRTIEKSLWTNSDINPLFYDTKYKKHVLVGDKAYDRFNEYNPQALKEGPRNLNCHVEGLPNLNLKAAVKHLRNHHKYD